MNTMKNFQKVRIENFRVDELRQAAQEGRLFLQLPAVSEQEKQQQARVEILRYVSRIDHCATASYRKHIRTLWEEMLTHPVTSPLFFLHRYQSCRGQPNYYRVNAIVFFLRECGVYQLTYTNAALHLLMEQATRCKNTYTGSSRYYPEHEVGKEIRKLLKLKIKS